jgi:uncharacterized protein with GYD domain
MGFAPKFPEPAKQAKPSDNDINHVAIVLLSNAAPLHNAKLHGILTRRMAMVTYVVLANFTDQGIRNVKESPKRADAFKQMAKTFGVTVKDLFWTQGRYDVVTIVEAPDESSAMSLSLSLGALGNVRTESLRAYSAAEMTTVVGKMI